MIELQKAKISEFGKIVTGKTPSSSVEGSYGDLIPFVTPSDNFDSKFITNCERYLSEIGKNSLQGKVLEKDSIFVTCIGSAMGKVAMATQPSITNQQINSIECNEFFEPNYVYYLLKNNYKLLRNAASGSTAVPILNKTDFENLEILIFCDKGKQQKIASVLSTLDDKIALNNQINATLEQMAKTLYDYWFVQFDFPDDNGKPYKTSGGEMVYNDVLKRDIPKGWEVETLNSLGEIVGGSTPSTTKAENFSLTDGTPWITPNDLSQNQGNKYIARGETNVTNQGIIDASLKKYPAGTVLMSSRAPIGYMAIARKEVTTNQGFKSFIPNKGYDTEFVYYAVLNSMKAITQSASGSTFKEISTTVLKGIPVVLPPKELANTYIEKASEIFSQQNNLEQQNAELTKLRDWLLPMLMNGQVTVQ